MRGLVGFTQSLSPPKSMPGAASQTRRRATLQKRRVVALGCNLCVVSVTINHALDCRADNLLQGFRRQRFQLENIVAVPIDELRVP